MAFNILPVVPAMEDPVGKGTRSGDEQRICRAAWTIHLPIAFKEHTTVKVL